MLSLGAILYEVACLLGASFWRLWTSVEKVLFGGMWGKWLTYPSFFSFVFLLAEKKGKISGNNLIWGIWSPVFTPLGNLDVPLVVNIFIDAAHSYPSVRSNCNFQNCKSNRIIPNSCSFSMKLWSNIPSSFNFICSAGPESYYGDL